MRADEKQVDGPELEREQEKETLVEHEEEELLPDAGVQANGLDQERNGMLLGAMRMILDMQHLTVELAALPAARGAGARSAAGRGLGADGEHRPVRLRRGSPQPARAGARRAAAQPRQW